MGSCLVSTVLKSRTFDVEKTNQQPQGFRCSSRHCCLAWSLMVSRHTRHASPVLIDRSSETCGAVVSDPRLCSSSSKRSGAGSTGTAHNSLLRGLAVGLANFVLAFTRAPPSGLCRPCVFLVVFVLITTLSSACSARCSP